MILTYRTRVEPFGLTVVTGQSNVHLTHKAAAIFLQMESGVPYDVATMAVEWNGVDPVTCINGFIRRGLAKKL